MKNLSSLTIGILVLLLVGGPIPTMASAFQDAVFQLLPKDGQRFGKMPGGPTLYGKHFILRMYEENRFQPIWNAASIQSLAKALEALANDGLNPSEYQFASLRPYLESPARNHQSLRETAKADIMLTEAYLRAMYNLYYGKTDPERLDPKNNFARARDGKDRSQLLLSWVKHARVDAAFNWARPKNRRYLWLKRELIRYRQIKAAEGWPHIPSGKIIRPGDRDRRIPLIRKRLAITGDLGSDSGPGFNDDSLLDGIINFQQRHYLTMNGEVDGPTLAAMNVPVEDRIDQIRVNMERQRWLFPTDTTEFLVVDIAGFTAYWLENEEIVWQDQIQVGKAFTQTPVFKDRISHIEFNPDWRNTTDHVDMMGQVRFLFPNRHKVFLHDANHWDMLSSPSRTTSTGSIRIANPLELAEHLLARQGWDYRRIDRIIDSERTTRVELEQPMPILIHYSTAWATEEAVSFKPDVYQRDPKLLAALNGPFVFHTPDLQHKRPSSKYSLTDVFTVKNDSLLPLPSK